MSDDSPVPGDAPPTPRPAAPGRIIAHRGASGEAPENTLAAFRLAAAQGARWIEFDVSLLGDGTPVVWHDARFERCSNAVGPLARADRAALTRIDAGGWFGAAFRGEPVATLDATLELIAELGLGANLEMKAHGAAPGPLAAAVAAALGSRPWAGTRMTVSSFDHGELVALRRLMPDMPIAVLYERPDPDWRGFLRALGAEGLHLDRAHLDADLLAAAGHEGRTVRVYTVNQPSLPGSLRDQGLGGVFTDYPRRFLADPDWAAWDRASG